MTENKKINEIINEFADGDMNMNSFAEKIYRLGFEDSKALSITDVMAMLPPVVYLEKVNRVEVIDEKGRSYVNWKPTNKISISMQDDGKTFKVFINL